MSQTSGVYINGEFSEPMTAQHNFANQYDLDNPARAMSLYARLVASSRHLTFTCTILTMMNLG